MPNWWTNYWDKKTTGGWAEIPEKFLFQRKRGIIGSPGGRGTGSTGRGRPGVKALRHKISVQKRGQPLVLSHGWNWRESKGERERWTKALWNIAWRCAKPEEDGLLSCVMTLGQLQAAAGSMGRAPHYCQEVQSWGAEAAARWASECGVTNPGTGSLLRSPSGSVSKMSRKCLCRGINNYT